MYDNAFAGKIWNFDCIIENLYNLFNMIIIM